MELRSTHRDVMANRPDIINKNTKEEIFILMDVQLSADRNVVQKEAEKQIKCKS
jgi:hypothetical protein